VHQGRSFVCLLNKVVRESDSKGKMHAGVNGDNVNSNSNLFHFLFYNTDSSITGRDGVLNR
jgi:hypothetical protein